MEPDQVDAALDAVEQPRKPPDVARRVVESLQDDVFERDPPLVGEVVPAQDGGVAVKAQRALTLSALRAVCRPSAVTAGAELAGDTAFLRAPRLAFTGDGSFTTIGASDRGAWRCGSGAVVIGGTSGSCGD